MKGFLAEGLLVFIAVVVILLSLFAYIISENVLVGLGFAIGSAVVGFLGYKVAR